MLKARRVLETAVYCDDLARTAEFYKALLALDPNRRPHDSHATHDPNNPSIIVPRRLPC